MDLYQLDLNLLVLFDALYRHRSVSAAADEICLSQSAFSHGLTRLRKRLGDELFVRINNVMTPTHRAQQLAGSVSQALDILHSGINTNAGFSPEHSELELTFAATDYTEYSLLPRLIGLINKLAPKIKVTVYSADNKIPAEKLITGELDFALGFSHEIEDSSTIAHQTWLEDSYCTIARKNHPALKQGLDLETFLALSHVRISPWGEKQAVVDLALAKLQKKRHVALQLTSVLAAPYTILHSDLLLTLPRLVAEQMLQHLDIELFNPPLTVPDYQLNLYWHKLNSGKASHQWLTGLIRNLHHGPKP
ncbi:LysR family transcriptional regulator [Thalassomonas viridans]|uniref:LysR family transcriptional regulator n=1 Tax=Thalassomonas viridans TaxID=137584 RepID=A0AAF0C948_9GAMM|nr:LysR family transcriptional regulator [Thalassomonas viridans]WDE07122.1 LysR family transcriptional regulator [Thalassomonas viridans]